MASRLLPDTFPAKTYLMMDNCSVEHPHVASWTADGTAFVVKDTSQLATEHLPRYFKHSNFQSFVRQLNIYGFKKDTTSPGSRDVVFRHDYFLQGREDLLESIQRTNKRSAKKASTATAASKAMPVSPSTYSTSPPLSIDEWDNQQPSLQSLQRQIAEMSAKIDILLSLSTHQSNVDLSNGAAAASVAAAGHKYPAVIGKKRRISGSAGYPSSEVSLDSDNDCDALDNDRPRCDSFPRMDVVEEEKTADIEPIDLETAKQGDVVGAAIDGDELSEFIDNMLEEEGILDDNIAEDDDISAIEGAGLQLGSNGASDADGAVFRSDAAATKIAPKAVEGEDQQPYSSPGNEATVDAVITQAERVDDNDEDLERGETLVAEAVPIWHYSGWHVPGGPPRGMRLALLIFIVLLLIASIVVPSVVVVRNQEEKRKRDRPPPPFRPGGPGGPGGEGGPVAEAIADAIEAGDLPDEGPVAEAIQNAIDAGVEAQKQKNVRNEIWGDGGGGRQRNHNGNPNDIGGRNQEEPTDAEKKPLFVQAFVKPKVEEKMQERVDSFFGDRLEENTFNATVGVHNITTTIDEVVYQCFPV